MLRNNYTRRGFTDNSLNLALVVGILFVLVAGIAITSVGKSNFEAAEQATNQAQKKEEVATTPLPPAPMPPAQPTPYTAQDVVVVAGGVGVMCLVVGVVLIWWVVLCVNSQPPLQSPKPKKAKSIKKSSFGGTERLIK